jgi:hypothetical protein
MINLKIILTLIIFIPSLAWGNLFYLTCKELDKQNDALETYWKLDLENKLLVN